MAIEIREVLVKDVYDAACRRTHDYRPGDVIPISRARALAWHRNPHAQSNDVSLVLAYVDGECVGYRGMFPAHWRKHGCARRMYWYSTYFVRPDQRRGGVGSALLRHTFDMGTDIGLIGSSAEAQAVYRKLGFFEMPAIQGLMLDITRLNYQSLPLRALRKLASKRGLQSRWLDRSIQLGVNTNRQLVLRAILAQLPDVAHRDGPLPDDYEALQDVVAPTRFDRDRTTIAWASQVPWVTTDPSFDTPGYYFRDLRERFGYHTIRTGDAGACANIWSFTRDGLSDVHLLDTYAARFEDTVGILRAVFDHALRWGADRIYLPIHLAPTLYGSSIARALFKSCERSFFMWLGAPEAESIRGDIAALSVSYADGDFTFA